MLGKSFLRTEFVSLTMSLPTVIGIMGNSVGICLICQSGTCHTSLLLKLDDGYS